jgi:hypothetical protein
MTGVDFAQKKLSCYSMTGKPFRAIAVIVGALSWLGCGTTKSRLATEQLLMSDAVDQAVAAIDFRSLSGKKVYFDHRYLINVKSAGFVNSEYVISSLRQQMVAADVRLQEKPDDAEIVVEARVGTLGTDGNEIVYGIPANRGLSEAATLIPNAPHLPAIPELSLARKESQVGAFKVAAFAYERRSGEPVWQSGIARAKTSSQDIWLFGAGPFQQGTIHGKTTFAGNDILLPGSKPKEALVGGPPVSFDEEFHFRGWSGAPTNPVRMVQHTEPVGPLSMTPASPGSSTPNPAVSGPSGSSSSSQIPPAALGPVPESRPVPRPAGAP